MFVLLHPISNEKSPAAQQRRHHKCRIRLVVQDICLSRRRSRVRLSYAVPKPPQNREVFLCQFVRGKFFCHVGKFV